MIQAEEALDQLRQAGFRLISGVPCSYLTPLINAAIDAPDWRYVNAANEGEAVAIASGAQVGGLPGVVMFQNSGLGNAVSPLTSLNATFRIPVLIICTWRGKPGGTVDEPQHELMGAITPELLRLMGIPWAAFPANRGELAATLEQATQHLRSQSTPFALVLSNKTIAPRGLTTAPPRRAVLCGRAAGTAPSGGWNVDEVLRRVQLHLRRDDLVIATTGFTGRALYALEDRPNQLYMVGSMGCASSFALGLAVAQPRRRVIVLDGDGAALMRLGALAAIGRQAPPNLLHILLDNGVHDSTGGQATVSSAVDFAAIAAACGYPTARRVERLEELEEYLAGGPNELGFLEVRTLPRQDRNLPRPTVSPVEVCQRFQQWISCHDRFPPVAPPVESGTGYSLAARP